MTSSLATLASNAKGYSTPLPAWAYALIAAACFALALAVLWSFRGNAAKIRGTDHSDAGGHH